MKPPEPCQKPFSPCWCETRPNNPHCTQSLSIKNDFLAVLIVVGILIYMRVIFNKKLKT